MADQDEESTRTSSEERKHGKKPHKPQTKKVETTTWTFPQNSLEDAIKVVQQIEEKYAGKPTKTDDLVALVGYKMTNDWRFLKLLRSVSQYGLTTGTGKNALVSLTPLANDIVAPSSSAQRQSALLRAFNNVEVFKNVSEHYAGKKIPEDEYFSNTLTREFEVPKDRVETFIKIFTSNLNYLKAFAADKEIKIQAISPSASIERNLGSEEIVQAEEVSGIREFLDTCFILMPFGSYYDRYFKEIYIPATKDAGFEPVRADGVFTTGSVIEQIWEEISKAKVLIAELTGKNPNVFYELGLSHAIPKPVILVSGSLDDVPFDLRHLRTILYDVREPDWSVKLKKHITEHLKSAKTDPDKSIPQPFRDGRRRSDDEPTRAPKVAAKK